MRELLPWGGHHLYHRLVAKPLARFYGRLAEAMPPGRTLDIGCGPGILAEALRHLGREVVAIDKDPAQVAIARKNHPELDVREAAAEALPFDDASFDVVVTSESFHHWSDRAQGTAEARRVLRPGGAFVVIEGCGEFTNDEMRRFLGGTVFPGFPAIVRRIFRTHGFTPKALEQEVLPVLRKWFDEVTVERIDGWWRVTSRVRTR